MMIAVDEDALICDFAETYHIYDWRGLPVSYAATLASGLRENSRIKMAITKRSASLEILLMAAMVDRLSYLLWANSKDAAKGKNRPVSIVERLTNNSGQESDIESFTTGADFLREWNKRTGKGGVTHGQ